MAPHKRRHRKIDDAEIVDGIAAVQEQERLIGKPELTRNEELFVIDSTGDSQVRKTVKRLRIDDILRPKSKIQAFGRPDKVQEAKKSTKKTKIPKKLIKAVSKKQTQPAVETPAAPETFDLWAADAASSCARRKVEAPLKAALAPVKKPHSGISYNPKKDKHQVRKFLARHRVEVTHGTPRHSLKIWPPRRLRGSRKRRFTQRKLFLKK